MRKVKRVGESKGKDKSRRRRVDVPFKKRIQTAVTLDVLMRQGVGWFLTDIKMGENSEEEVNPEEADIPQEGDNEDSEIPIDEWDYEWSPWCEDTEKLSLRDFLRRYLDPTVTVNKKERSLIKKVLNCSDDRRLEEMVWTEAEGRLRWHLMNLLAIYRFNYARTPWIPDEPIQPDVIVDRVKDGSKWKFEIRVPDYYPDLPDPNDFKECWENILTSFTQLLIDKIPEFFRSDNWEDAEKRLGEKLKDNSWTEKKLASEWRMKEERKKKAGKSPKVKVEGDRPKDPLKTYLNLVSNICQHRYICLSFFNNKCFRFSRFFKEETEPFLG